MAQTGHNDIFPIAPPPGYIKGYENEYGKGQQALNKVQIHKANLKSKFKQWHMYSLLGRCFIAGPSLILSIDVKAQVQDTEA